MNTNSYFTVQVTKAGNLRIVITNPDGTEVPATFYYWVNSVPNAARDNYDGSITTSSNVQYILINGSNSLPVGTIIRFYRAETTRLSNDADTGWYTRFMFGSANFKVYGNLASLIGFSETIPTNCFRYLFYKTNVIDASELDMPWTTLSEGCFRRMFYNSYSLIEPPTLKATTLAHYCYCYMFRGSSTLAKQCPLAFDTVDTITTAFQEMYFGTAIENVTVPKLHFTNGGRISAMFRGCANLKTATVETFDETIPTNAYQHLFRDCTGLETVTCMAKSFHANAFADWLLNASATGTFIKDKDTTWERSARGIPEGWTVKNANQNTQFLDFSSADRIMYNGNNHIKCIYGPNNQLLWTEEEYFTLEATGSGTLNLNIDNSGSAEQIEPVVLYYWKNTIPNAARDNYTGVLTAGGTTKSVSYDAGDVIRFWRAEQTAWGNGNGNVNNCCYFNGMSNCKVYGNVASLVNYVSELPSNCFPRLFYFVGVTDFSGLIIPWNTIPAYGLQNFIYGDSQIYSESQLPFYPATTVNDYGYLRMIRALGNLTSIDMTKHFCCKYAGTEAFSQMFIDTKLQSITVKWDIEPISSSTTRMFANMTATTATPPLRNIINLDPNPTSTKYQNWTPSQLANLGGTFTKATGANWDSGVNGIPTGWTVVEA